MIRRIAVISFSCAILTVSQACAEMSEFFPARHTYAERMAAKGGIGKVGNPNVPSANMPASDAPAASIPAPDTAVNTPAPAPAAPPPAATPELIPAPAPVQGAANMAPLAATPLGKPLLIIRFNRNHVYFADALREAIKNAENAKAGIAYNVVNYVPAGGTREITERRNDMADQNLHAVIGEMQSLGVDMSRITYNTLPAGQGMPNQEVDIYVK